MEHDLVLEGRVVTDEGIVEEEIGVSDGKIADIGHGLKGSRRTRTGRSLIFPGFIDMHVHLREPGWEHKEDFRTGTAAAVHGGVTTVVDMPNNPDPAVSNSTLDVKRRLAGEKALVDVLLYGGVDPQNLQLVPTISGAVVGYKIYLSETTGSHGFPEDRLEEAVRMIAETGRPASFHCEDQRTIDEAKRRLGDMRRQVPYADLRLPESELAAVSTVAAALTKQHVSANVCHASLGETLSMVGRARSGGLDLNCEATLHHLYFSRRDLDRNPMLKTNPPLRSEEDREALIQGVRLGNVSFVVTDHAPHTMAEKMEKGAAGVPGLDDFSHVVSWLIRDQGVDPTAISKAASTRPARFLGMKDRGGLAVGMRGDFSVLDLHSPEKVEGESLRTKCGWSPYEGREFPGRARWTLVAGEALLDDFEFVR